MKKLFIFIFLLIGVAACSPQYTGHIATSSTTADVTLFISDSTIKYESAVVERSRKTHVSNKDTWSNTGDYNNTEEADLGIHRDGFVKIETANGETVMFRADNVIFENIETKTTYGDLDANAINAAEAQRYETALQKYR